MIGAPLSTARTDSAFAGRRLSRAQISQRRTRAYVVEGTVQRIRFSQNSVDTFLRSSGKRVFYCWDPGKLTTPVEITSLRLKACRAKIASLSHNSSNEKEIRFAIRILQTSSPLGRPALLCGNHNRPAGAARERPLAQSANSHPIVQAQFRGVLPVVKFDISPPLRDMKPLPWKQCTLRENEDRDIMPHAAAPLGPVVPDPVVQRVLGKIGIPAPIISFDGNSNLCGCSPPDPNGAVGPNHVVTMANLHFQIFDKSGNSLFGPAANNTLWSGFGGDCQTDNAGDPVVLYDQLADRWLLTQFTSSGPTYFECVALSQTNDPTGSFFRYAISTGNNFPDYPKAWMWPDAYYFSTREFLNGSTFVGAGAYALDRAQALAGNPNPTIVGFLAPPTPLYVVGDGLLPSNLDGQTPPPAGSPNFFVGSQDDNASYGAPSDALNIYKFHYDPVTPANSTFTAD